MADDPITRRDDALLTALALIEQHEATADDPHLAESLLAGLDAEACIRLIASLASLARCLAEDLAEVTDAASADAVVAGLRERFTAYLGGAA